jgi:hypothetical protein
MYKLHYEKQVYSQHGEDGIIEMMTNSIINPDKTFLEIGWGDGGTNMTNYLQYDKDWSGVGVDARENPKGKERFTDKFKHIASKVYPHNAQQFMKEVPYNCELFLNGGFRPKTVCVEFTDQFGPNVTASFPHVPSMPWKTIRKGKLTTSGCSLQKWKLFFEHFNYSYFGFDTSSTNCFFYNAQELVPAHLENLPILSNADLQYSDDSKMIEHINHSAAWKPLMEEIYTSDIGL